MDLADRIHLLWHEMVLLLVRCPEISRSVRPVNFAAALAQKESKEHTKYEFD